MALGLLVLIGFLIANIIDYRRYTRAAKIEHYFGGGQMPELAQACLNLLGGDYRKITLYPKIIEELNPRYMIVGSDYAEISLYGHSDGGSVFIVFEKYPDGNLVLTLCDYVHRWGESRTIYVKDQKGFELTNPQSRILTIGQAANREYEQWIVLPNEIRVVLRSGYGGTEILGRRTISTTERTAIEGFIRALPSAVRGRHFRSNVMDGFQLHIRTSPDGRPGPDDIELDNTWIDEVGTLVDLIAQMSPPDHKLKFREIMEKEMQDDHLRQSSVTWAEQDKADRTPLPWWCVWPRS